MKLQKKYFYVLTYLCLLCMSLRIEGTGGWPSESAGEDDVGKREVERTDTLLPAWAPTPPPTIPCCQFCQLPARMA